MGKAGRLPVLKQQLEQYFPRIRRAKWSKTSEKSDQYNCIAHAACKSDRKWWPSLFTYWPPGVPREETLQAFVAAFEALGYEVCANGDLEAEYEKVAIYSSYLGDPTHAARQLSDGSWSSKLGDEEDISHDLTGLEGGFYGNIAVFMRKRSSTL